MATTVSSPDFPNLMASKNPQQWHACHAELSVFRLCPCANLLKPEGSQTLKHWRAHHIIVWGLRCPALQCIRSRTCIGSMSQTLCWLSC